MSLNRHVFAKISKYPFGGKILELTEEEIQQYKAGGYVVEEYADGGESKCPEGMASDGKGGCIEISSVFNEQEEFEKTLPKTERKYYDKEGNLLETVPDYGTIYVTGKDDPKYKEYQDRLKFYNKAKKLHNDEGIKEWTRQVANRKDLYDSKKNNPTDWSADEISRSKKRYENLKGQKELYTDYRGDYKSERYTSQLPTVNWEDAKIASQKKSDWATYWDLGVKGSIQGTYGDYDHIPDAWSDLLSEALKTTVRPTKYFRGEGNMKPVFTYPSLNVKVLDEDILKEKSLSTPTTLKTQDPDEIYGEHSFRTGNRVVNGVLTPAEPESTSLPTKPLVKKSTPGTVVPPAMELKWFKSKAGTWYQDYVPTQGKEYNLNTGSYLQNGGESKCPEGYVFYNGQCVKWQEPKIIETDKNTGYNAATGEISQDTRPGSIENNGWWTEHEKYHHLQNLGGGMSTAGFLGQRPNNIVASDQAMGNYYNRRDTELEAQTDAMIKADPNLQFIPRNKLQGFTEGFPGANALMYQDPTTVEGEARVREKQFKKDAISMFPKKQNGGYIDVELNDNEVEQYKDKGYVVEMVDGGGVGDPPGSSNNPPNRNDSIAVMNNAIKQEEFYKNYEKDPDAFAYSIQKNDAGKNWLDWMQDARTEFLGHGSIDNRIRTEKGVHHVPFNEYYKNIDDNKFKQRDLANGILSLNAPMALYDKRIFPQSFNNLKDDKGVNILGDHVTLPKYEPLAVTPWDMLNDNQKQERLDKYGTSGTPFGSFVKPKGTLDSKESINVNLMKQGFATDNKSARAFKKKLWEEVYPDTPHKTKDNAAQNIKLNKWIFDNEDKLQGFKETGSLTEGREKIPEAPEPEFTPLPTRPLQTTPLVKKSTPGTIKPPQSTVKWVYNKKLGRWHEIQRAVKPEDLESRKIGFLQDGGEIRELTDEEVEQYKAGGYIIEEYPDGGITGGPEYDSRYGILGRFGYKNNFKGRDRSTQNTLSADIYGGRFGLGARGAYEFGSEKRGGFPAKNFMKTTIGRDNVRGFYGDVKGGSEIHAIKDRTNELNITPFGGFSIQSKAAGSAMPDADLLGSRVGLNYGIGANYKRKFKNDSNFNVYGSISGNPVLGKFTDKESYESENTNFAPQFNVGTRYTLPLNSNIRKINKKIKQKQKNLYPISNSSGSRASFTYEQ